MTRKPPQWLNFTSSRQGVVISPGRNRRVFEGACKEEPGEPLKRQGKQLRARPTLTRRYSPRGSRPPRARNGRRKAPAILRRPALFRRSPAPSFHAVQLISATDASC